MLESCRPFGLGVEPALRSLLGEGRRRTRRMPLPELVGMLSRAAELSRAYSRIVASIRKRSSPIVFTRL